MCARRRVSVFYPDTAIRSFYFLSGCLLIFECVLGVAALICLHPGILFFVIWIFLTGFRWLLMKCKTLQMLEERLKERLWDLFAPDPYYSTLCISVQSFFLPYTPTGLQAHFSAVFLLIFPPIKFSLSVLCCFSLFSVTILFSIYLICKALLCSLS